MTISLLGSVRVGKGTRAQWLSNRLNYVRISSGNLVRDQLEAGTKLGQKLKGHVERGELIPYDIMRRSESRDRAKGARR